MKILVTGSNGLLGQKLTALLQRDNSVQLIATAKGKSVIPITKGEFISDDVYVTENFNAGLSINHEQRKLSKTLNNLL